VADIDSGSLLVVSALEATGDPMPRRERGVVDHVISKSVSTVNVNMLKENIQRVLKQLHSIVDCQETSEHGLALDEITVTVQILADAQVALLGNTAGLEAQNGMTLVLRRRH